MDMVSFLNYKGIRCYEHGEHRDKHLSQGWTQFVCPICGGAHLWLGYNKAKDFFYCYNHGYSKKSTILKAWFPTESVRDLLSQIDAPTNVSQSGKRRRIVDPDRICVPPRNIISLMDSPSHMQYICERGLDPICLSKVWRISAIGSTNEYQYRNRVFIPVYNHQRSFVSWVTRTIDPSNKYRYLAAPPKNEVEPLKTLLYGEQFVSPCDAVVVTEGVFDALRIGRNAVATFGKKVTSEQFLKISRYAHRIICFDNEKDTQEQARALMRALSVYPGKTDNICLDAPDPGSATQEEVNELLQYINIY